MQFQRLSVQNWRCFEDESIRFQNGVTVLHGNNGAGKSSLLEAAFFALYGTDALETGTTMDDVVTTDEDTANVILSFAHRGASYEVTREIRIRSSTYQDAELTTPPGQPDLDQANAIDELIQHELRLNADDFLNSAYVRQGDVTRLIEATPKQRQRIIDNLLQMSKLERYRERMNRIGVGVGRVYDTKEGQMTELADQISAYDESKLRSRKQQLEAFQTELDERRTEIKEQIEGLTDEQDQAEEIVSDQQSLMEEVGEAKTDVEDSMAVLATEVSEFQSLQSELTDAENAVNQHRDKLGSLLDAGSGELNKEFSDATKVVDAVSDRSETMITDTLGEQSNDAQDASNDGEASFTSETDLEGVSKDLVGVSDDDTEDDSDQSTQQAPDKILEDLSISLPDSSPAVTGDAGSDEIITIGSSDLLSGEDIDPVINPSVEVDLALIRVPTPGLGVDPGTVDVEMTEGALERAQNTVADIRDHLQTLENTVIEKRSSAAGFEQEATEHEREGESHVNTASEILGELADIRRGRTLLANQREELQSDIEASDLEIDTTSNVSDELEHVLETIELRIDRLERERNYHQERATKIGERIDQADRLLAEGNCPECGRPVEGAPNVEHREEWEKKQTYHQQLVEQMESDITRLDTWREEAQKFVEETRELYANDLRVTVDETVSGSSAKQVNPKTNLRLMYQEAADAHLEARTERQSAYSKRVLAVTNYLAALLIERAAERTLAHLYEALAREALLQQIADTTDDRTSAEQERQLAESQLENQTASVKDAHEDLKEAVTRHLKAVAEFDPETLESARTTVEENQEKIDKLEDKLEIIRDIENAVSTDRGDLTRQLTQLDNLRDQRTKRKAEAKAVSALQAHVDELESMFVDLRADLRKQNVERLEELLQEMFDTLYRNDAYADIELNKDYDATLIEKGGGRLPPSKLSGGESAVFNLALRGAIYRLLTEGFEDDVPMPPLILDEPTAHLDAGHVERLDDVVEAMRTAGVEQTIVVSHDKELIDGADQRISV